MSDWKSEEISLISVLSDKYETLYTRTGDCCRCGQCCSNIHDAKTDKIIVCEHLSFDADGFAVCAVYCTDKYPYGCEIFPIAPDPQYDKCTYVFTAK